MYGIARKGPIVNSAPSKFTQVCARLVTLHYEESGQALVEMALCLPILLMIVMGLCTFGIAMNNYIALTAATSSGTRALSVSRGGTSDPCQLLSSTVSTSAPLLKSASLTYNLVLTPSGGAASTYTGTSCTGAASNLSTNATAKVTVTYPCSLVVLRQNYAVGCTLTAVDAELVQ